MTLSLLKSKMLTGKSKREVRELLDDEGNSDSFNVWTFKLGIRPELFNIDESYLQVEFEGNKVVNVEQHK
jgi:hypothetical protein